MEEGPPPLLIIISIRQSTSFLYLSSGQCPHPSRVGPKPCRSAGKGFFLSSSNALCCCHCRCRCMPPHHGMLASQMQRGRAKPNEGERGTARRVCELGPVECRGKKRRSAILESLLFLQVAKEEEEERRRRRRRSECCLQTYPTRAMPSSSSTKKEQTQSKQ